MPVIPDKEHARMVSGWQQWRVTLAVLLDNVHDALEAKEYDLANQIVAAITQEQAKMSVRMTNILIRNGIIKGDASDDD